MKQEADQNRAEQRREHAAKVKEMRKNIKKQPRHDQQPGNGPTISTTKQDDAKVSTEQMQEDLQSLDDEDSEEGEENIMFNLKQKMAANENPFTENLYDPLQDDKCEAWVDKRLSNVLNSLRVANTGLQ